MNNNITSYKPRECLHSFSSTKPVTDPHRTVHNTNQTLHCLWCALEYALTKRGCICLFHVYQHQAEHLLAFAEQRSRVLHEEFPIFSNRFSTACLSGSLVAASSLQELLATLAVSRSNSQVLAPRAQISLVCT